jgi:hypothetical protein
VVVQWVLPRGSLALALVFAAIHLLGVLLPEVQLGASLGVLLHEVGLEAVLVVGLEVGLEMGLKVTLLLG